MYELNSRVIIRQHSRTLRSFLALLACVAVANTADAQQPAIQSASAEFATPNIIRKISRASERLEMTSNSSRILTLDTAIPRVQVNNPELIKVTPLSATEIQVSALKPGVTQVNMWDSDQKVHTVDVVIYGDVRELEFALRTQFPNSTVKVKKFSQSLMLTGFVDSPDHVSPIVRLSEDYAPKVINNLQVGGVQQVLLRTRIFEVSRTKLRRLGVDFAHFSTSGGGFIGSRPSGLLSATGIATGGTAGGSTLEFGIVSGNNNFFGFLDALQQNNLAKILAEPNIVSVSGRPAQFLEGGEIPIIVPQSLGTSSIEFKPFGTQVDFLPIVLGNGNIRLEVRPRVSDIDTSIGINLQNQVIPGFRVRQADTAVEMKAGQTFALAGLIQRKTESIHRGLPFVSDIPVLGVPFRKVEEEVNEIELLILVTPEFVDAMQPHEVPPCGPGMGSMSPDNCTLYFGGHLEVPNAYGPCGPGCEGCGNCGPAGCATGGCDNCGGAGCDSCGSGVMAVPADGFSQGSESGYNNVPTLPSSQFQEGGMPYQEGYGPSPEAEPIHGELQLPGGELGGPSAQSSGRYEPQRTASYHRVPTQTAPPVGQGSDYNANGGLIGPVGYDVE